MSQVFRSCGQSIGASASVSSPSSKYSGLISFRTDWFDFLAVQATLKNLLQPLLKNISSSAHSLYGRNLTSIHDHWKNHSFDYMDLRQQSDVSAF